MISPIHSFRWHHALAFLMQYSDVIWASWFVMSHYRQLRCLFNCLYRRTSSKNMGVSCWYPCMIVTGEFPVQGPVMWSAWPGMAPSVETLVFLSVCLGVCINWSCKTIKSIIGRHKYFFSISKYNSVIILQQTVDIVLMMDSLLGQTLNGIILKQTAILYLCGLGYIM